MNLITEEEVWRLRYRRNDKIRQNEILVDVPGAPLLPSKAHKRQFLLKRGGDSLSQTMKN